MFGLPRIDGEIIFPGIDRYEDLSLEETSLNTSEFEQLWVEENEDPPTVAKKTQILAAVLQNQVDPLKSLLDSPEWYNVKNKLEYNILQISIFRERLEVFDYLLSLPDFPLEYSTKDGKTALVVALSWIHHLRYPSEHYSYQLLKKGACKNVICLKGKTPLHCTFEAHYSRVAKFLIEEGADLDARSENGQTILEVAATSRFQDSDNHDLESMLLMYGATPTLEAFQNCLATNKPSNIQENLFLNTFDAYFDEEIPLSFILKLAVRRSPFFHELIKYPVYLEEDTWHNISDKCFDSLCAMGLDYLKVIIEKFSSLLKIVLTTVSPDFTPPFINIENLNAMIENELRPEVIYLLNASSDWGTGWIIKPTGESAFTEFYCFCLSYGLNITENNLQRVYFEFGDCELFRILLHMDIEMNVELIFRRNIAAALFYDMSFDFEQIIQSRHTFTAKECREFVSYFAHSRLREEYLRHVEDGNLAGRTNLPQVPLLVELARNTFRKFFIEKLQIKTSRKFYTLVKNLRLNIPCKEILAFERKLY